MPAVATTIYTVSSINNAFEIELNPMIGFLDSHVSLRQRNLTFLAGYEHASIDLPFESVGNDRSWVKLLRSMLRAVIDSSISI